MATTKLNDLDVDAFLVSCVQVEPMALQEEFVRLPGDFAYWNERHAQASRQHASAKMEREKIASGIMLEARASATTKTTVGEIDAKVTLDPTYQTARGAESDAEIEVERLNNVLNALRHKKDMLMQLGFQQRAEMGSDPVLREQVLGSRRQREER